MDTLTNFSIVPLSRAGIDSITQWRYAPPYDLYNLDGPLRPEDIDYFLDPAFAYHEIANAAGVIVGFCSFGVDAQVPGGDYQDDALDIGMGIRPDLTGHGWGAIFAKAVMAFARDQYRPPRLRVTIAAFNQRAQRVWQKLGFQPVTHFARTGDQMPFISFISPAG